MTSLGMSDEANEGLGVWTGSETMVEVTVLSNSEGLIDKVPSN